MEVYYEYPTSTSLVVTGAESPEAGYQAGLNHLAQVVPSDQASFTMLGTGQSPNDEGRYEFGVVITK